MNDGRQDNEVRTFSIGDFKFDTFHEYRDGQEDLKKIEAINSELDIHDPEVALRLYHLIRNDEITFKSPIGDDFAAHISDIVADGSGGRRVSHQVLDDDDEDERLDAAKKRIRMQRIAGVSVVTVAMALFAVFGFREVNEWLKTRRMSELAASVEESERTKSDSYTRDANTNSAGNSSADPGEKDPFEHSEIIDPSTLEVLSEYKKAFDTNNEMVGWIKIDDTDINYPVVQRSSDNEYYLNHDFDKHESAAGSIFCDYRSDVVNPTTNTILYGHNMKNDTMFGEVDDYLEKKYYDSHRDVTFNTIYEKRKYEVVAVCLAEVAYQDENNYRYYNFIQATNQSEWDAFVANVKELSVHGKDIELQRTDEVLTLSTCNNYTQDGRLFLVCKRIKE